MSTCFGVLLEAVSIQRFIFQSKKLKTNLGASYLVQHKVFHKYLEKAVFQVFGIQYKLSWEAWKTNPTEVKILNEPFEIGYIGGGNALLLFQDKGKAEEVIKAWTRILLVHAPGVLTAAAIGTLKLEGFKETLDALFIMLRSNKSKWIPQTVIQRHGFTADCSQSGLSAEYWWETGKEYVSSVIGPKLEASEPAREYFQDFYKNRLRGEYCFPDEFEKLGSISEEDSHIAVVHIDGNRMANRFKHAESLVAFRNLSISVHSATMTAFEELVDHAVVHYKCIMEDLGFNPDSSYKPYHYPTDDNKKCLPLTPIVLGGDDLTFVCDGKLGVYFAKLFIEAFEKKQVSDKKKLTACAGIAVIKTKYPFYRGYQLAEDLCLNAKNLNKEEEDPDKLVSALDFHISMSGISGSLEQIRKTQFTSPEGSLLSRPYKMVAADTDEQSLDQMLKLTANLAGFPKNKILAGFPKNKIKELQRVLSLSKDACKQFVEENKYRGRKLPLMPGRTYHETLFENEKTIYFDMIEMLEFYPKFEMERKGGDENL
jgi:hypothetical protein